MYIIEIYSNRIVISVFEQFKLCEPNIHSSTIISKELNITFHTTQKLPQLGRVQLPVEHHHIHRYL